MMHRLMMMLTAVSRCQDMRLSARRAKPALQKAETAWKRARNGVKKTGS